MTIFRWLIQRLRSVCVLISSFNLTPLQTFNIASPWSDIKSQWVWARPLVTDSWFALKLGSFPGLFNVQWTPLVSNCWIAFWNSQLEVYSFKLIHVFRVLKQSCVTLDILVYKGFKENKIESRSNIETPCAMKKRLWHRGVTVKNSWWSRALARINWSIISFTSLPAFRYMLIFREKQTTCKRTRKWITKYYSFMRASQSFLLHDSQA